MGGRPHVSWARAEWSFYALCRVSATRSMMSACKNTQTKRMYISLYLYLALSRRRAPNTLVAKTFAATLVVLAVSQRTIPATGINTLDDAAPAPRQPCAAFTF